MRRYEAAELKRFLVEVDRALKQRAAIVIIGGSALSLGYGVASVTSDIDTIGYGVASVTSDIDTLGLGGLA